MVPGEEVGKEGKVSFLKNERKEKVRQLAREMKIKNRQNCFCFFFERLRFQEKRGKGNKSTDKLILLRVERNLF